MKFAVQFNPVNQTDYENSVTDVLKDHSVTYDPRITKEQASLTCTVEETWANPTDSALSPNEPVHLIISPTRKEINIECFDAKRL